MSIEVRGVSKAFGAFHAVRDVTFTVGSGELFALLGPSGCGKTTLLRIIAGLETADAGSVLLGGEDATSQTVRERGVGFVFQHYALFRHMTVFENVAFGLRVRPAGRRPSHAEVSRRVHDLLGLVQLDYLADRYPSQLSGGQRQRVALARALAVEPKVLLLDEPFGALDANVRRDLRRWLRRLHDEIKLTSVFVTHDQEEAFDLADRVVIMNRGRIEQDGRPEDVIDAPASPFVMNFVGNVNRLRGTARQGQATFGVLSVPFGQAGDPERPVSGYARPHELLLARTDTGDGFWATVHHLAVSGALLRLEAVTDDRTDVHVDLTRTEQDQLCVKAGERVYLTPRRLQVFEEE
jgi:sulfate/thiosulfate transport system ATP-binding protein